MKFRTKLLLFRDFSLHSIGNFCIYIFDLQNLIITYIYIYNIQSYAKIRIYYNSVKKLMIGCYIYMYICVCNNQILKVIYVNTKVSNGIYVKIQKKKKKREYNKSNNITKISLSYQLNPACGPQQLWSPSLHN